MSTAGTKYIPTTRMDWAFPTHATDSLIEKLNELKHQPLKKVLLKNYNNFVSYAKLIKSGKGHPNDKLTLLRLVYKERLESLENSEFLAQTGTGNYTIKSFYLSTLKAIYRKELRHLNILLKESKI